MKKTIKQVEVHSFIHRKRIFYAWIIEEKVNGYPTRAFYIQARNYGIISYCFGIDIDTLNADDFLKLVKKELHDYAEDYYQDYVLQDDLLRQTNK